jgi:hypothetical protein
MSGMAAAAQDGQQPLADVARDVRRAREAEPRVAGQVTNESVRRVGIPVVIGRVGEVIPGLPVAESEPAPVAAEAVTAAEDPDEALARQRRFVQGLLDEEVRVQLEINRQRARFQAPVVSQRERESALEGMSTAEASLDTLRVELAEALEVLAALEEAAASESSPAASSAVSSP